MFTAKFRDCRRSFLSEAPLVGGLVKGGRFVGLELEKSPRALVAANAHGASISPGVQPISQFTGILPDAAQPRGFSHAPGINVAQGESVRDLFREAQIARLAGYCYDDLDTLRKNVAAEGLQAVHTGETFFTRWYCCTGPLSGNVPGDDTVYLPQEEPTPTAANTLHVFFRGVMWRSPEVETVRVWQKLSQSWGSPIICPADSQDSSPDADPDTSSTLVAHSGILDMAQELYIVMRPHLLQHSGPIRIAGHSLGGTLALLVASQFILADEINPMHLRLHAFGAPPALSHTSCSADINSNCGAHVRQRLGLPAANVRNWVLDFDPVPRATTAANPYLQVARRNEVFRSMYDLAGMAATALGVSHPAQRFFFRHVGHVFMLTHSDPDADSGIRKLPEATADEVLAEAPVVGRGEGFRPRVIARELLRSVLDHTHTSYGHDLLVAAKLALHQYGIDGVVGTSTPLPSFDFMGGMGVPSSPQDFPQRRSNGSSSGEGMDRSPRSSGRSGDSGSPDIAQWPHRRSLAARAHSGTSAGEDSRNPLQAGVRSVHAVSAAEPDVVAEASHRGQAGVLAAARRRIAGVRIKNGVVWQPENGAQASVQLVGKNAVFAHRRQDWAPVEFAEQVCCKGNAAGANGDVMQDVLPLRSSAGKQSARIPDRGAKRCALSERGGEHGVDLDAL